MKTSKIFWGLGFVLMAAFLLLDAFGVITPLLDVVGGITWFQIVAGLLLIFFIISRLIKLKISEIFIPFAFLFMFFEKNIAYVCGLENKNIINNWLLFLCALLITIGFSILFPNDGKFRFKFSGNKKIRKNKKGGSLGSTVVYIDCNDFVEENVVNRLGECIVHFENEDNFMSGAILNVDNELGRITIFVPSAWRITNRINNSLGSIKTGDTFAGDGAPTLIIEGNNELGEITVKPI